MKKSQIILAAVLIGGSAATTIIGNKVGLTRETWPGWVQAIGSIAALGVAIFVMSTQNSAAAKLVEDTDLKALQRRARAVSALVDHAHLQLNTCINEVENKARSGSFDKVIVAWDSGVTILRQAKSALEQIPAYELGSYGMVKGLHQSINAISIFEHASRYWLDNTGVTRPMQDVFNIIGHLRGPAGESAARFRDGLKELGIY
ncbi:hypothetical protein [Janthinobacterium lividum]|uniref:hypothetical protein n=1 Tax=Janthinobacterium lividum TaxID=29581 RepID=UPI001595A35C|nr:hypothetical protein [Janthinobacterium lividum]QKY08751.1 hypothetical protein G8765_13955 [Janthinobacterium lividum]QKY09531.1 hypothetical protein G8765_18430 [Janthinobacterium lividum]